MALVFQEGQALGQGIQQAGTALGQALQQRGLEERQEDQRLKVKEEKKEEQIQHGITLGKNFIGLDENASNLDVARAYINSMEAGVPVETITAMSTMQKALQKPGMGGTGGLGFDSKDDMVDLLTKFGMDDEQAQRESELYLSLPTGGRTAYANFLFDRMQRGQLGAKVQPQVREGGVQPQPGGPGVDVSEVEDVEVQQYQFPELNLFEGLNSKEKASREKDLFNANATIETENNQKLRGFDNEMRRLDAMEKINDGDKLPKGLERLNINWTTGDIRFPALANAETQLFVKDVNDFTVKARETFGARVTNFELGTFMRRLPTLANTEEGRRLILAQMKASTSLEKLYHDSINKTYDHYGLRGIDSQQAKKVAEELRTSDEAVLVKEYNDVLKSQEIYEARQLAPEGKIPAMNPQGKVVFIWRNQAANAEKKGYRPL